VDYSQTIKRAHLANTIDYLLKQEIVHEFAYRNREDVYGGGAKLLQNGLESLVEKAGQDVKRRLRSLTSPVSLHMLTCNHVLLVTLSVNHRSSSRKCHCCGQKRTIKM
jgi:CII-binding regulator of phage lambda lysogenization HflD